LADTDYVRPAAACVCGKAVGEGRRKGAIFCSKRCGVLDWARRNPERSKQVRAPKLCAWYAGHCSDCGRADGRRAPWTLCAGCARQAQLIKARAAGRQAAEALHRAAGRQTRCDECNAVFCPLYGSSHATLCMCCVGIREGIAKRAGKAKRRAIERGAAAESVDPYKVFDRDGWRCRLCGVKTPRAKRGTYDDNAPELDHILPLSKGGAHTYANTQCACRRCNGLKADRPLGQMLIFG